jgi:hypothetical protein
MPVRHTLPYYEHLYITALKSFISLGPGMKVIAYLLELTSQCVTREVSEPRLEDTSRLKEANSLRFTCTNREKRSLSLPG